MLEALEPRRLMSVIPVPAGGNLQAAVNSARPGDTIEVAASYVGPGFVLGWDGPQNNLTIHGNGATISATNSKTRDGIDVEDCSGIVIAGFSVRPVGKAWRSGIRMAGGGTGNRVADCRVLMRAGDTMGIYSSFQTDWTVSGCEVSGNDDAGIYASNSAVNPTISDNYVHDLSASTGQAVGIHLNGDASQGGTGIIDGATISGNRIANVSTGISMDGVRDGMVELNLVMDCHGKGINLYQQDAASGSSDSLVTGNDVFLASDGYFGIGVRDGSVGCIVGNNHVSGGFAFCFDATTWPTATLAANGISAGARMSRNDDRSRLAATGVAMSDDAMRADTNFDGRVGGDDYNAVDAGLGTPLMGWASGDTNGDGALSAADYNLIDALLGE